LAGGERLGERLSIHLLSRPDDPGTRGWQSAAEVVEWVPCRESAKSEIQKIEVAMEATIQVRQRGTLTLPAELREKYGIQVGDSFRIVDLDGVFVLTPMVPMVPELAREIERMRLEAGVSSAELLATLRDQRGRYYQGNRSDG